MTIDSQNLLESILKSLDRIDYIRPEDIPGIDLYMDQVTTFMDSQLSSSRRYEDDKILTKTMINNYAKNNLLPPPLKKKYTKEHMLMLIFIYYFKNLLSFTDIEELFRPITGGQFSKDGGLTLEDIYNEVFSLEAGQMENLKEDIKEKFQVASSTFQNAGEDDQEYLRLFAFICELSFDVYLKKQMIEMLADELKAELPAPRQKGKAPKNTPAV